MGADLEKRGEEKRRGAVHETFHHRTDGQHVLRFLNWITRSCDK